MVTTSRLSNTSRGSRIGGGSLAQREARRRQRCEQRLACPEDGNGRGGHRTKCARRPEAVTQQAALSCTAPVPHILECRRLRAVSDHPSSLQFCWEVGSVKVQDDAVFQLQFKLPDEITWNTASDCIHGCRFMLHGLSSGAVYLVRVRGLHAACCISICASAYMRSQ